MTPETANARVRQLLLVVAFAVGCDGGAAPDSVATKPARVAKSAPDDGPALKVAEVFAERFLGQIHAGNAEGVGQLIDYGALFERSAEGLPFPAKTKREVRSGFLQGVRGAGLAQKIVAAYQEGGSYALLRLHTQRGTPRALFRMVSEEGVNYHDFEIVEQDGGAVAVDLFVYLTGEKLSQTCRRGLIPLAANSSRNWLQKLTLGESSYAKHLSELQAMNNHRKNGMPSEAIRVYKSLPAELQKDKNVLLIRHQAAMMMLDDEKQILEAVDDFRKHHPDDACVDFLMIDALALRGRHDAAIEAIDRFDKAVGGDPYLDVLRANMLLEKGDGVGAIDAARRAVAGAPEVPETHWTLIGVGLSLGDHRGVYDGLKSIEQAHGQEFDDLRGVDEYADFVGSPEGVRWLAEHGYTDAAP